ncbi:MAG: bifunctional heptose 7-phosphate kinase/heptose 1-phosphate adenyltransferase [Saprospiraceae bacterium]
MNKEEIFQAFERLKVLVIGDVMIDRYLVGKVERISPEAPVPIVNLERQDNRLGGAANVALNLKALGATPFLCSIIGTDETATTFQQLMKDESLSNEGIIQHESRITTVKTRVLAKSQQLLRFDSEITVPINSIVTQQFIQHIKTLIDTKKIDVVLFQDYNKGILVPKVITTIIDYCNQKKIPTTADPKRENFFVYKEVTLFKPNLKEVSDALDYSVNPNDNDSLAKAAKVINTRLNNIFTLITLSEKGMYLDNNKERIIIPTQSRHIADVCGAGDTVISVTSLGLALGINMKLTCQLANLAGGIVCESTGVVPVDKDKLIQEFKALN